jgi:hypothetical protein
MFGDEKRNLLAHNERAKSRGGACLMPSTHLRGYRADTFQSPIQQTRDFAHVRSMSAIGSEVQVGILT